jgi:hypothetical protein
MKHVADMELALYATGDLSPWRLALARLHVLRCERCAGRVEAFRADRRRLREAADALPEGVDWNALAAEMTANIHVGLAAGECVAPREKKPALWKWDWHWRPAAVTVGVAVLLVGAWWLNVPASDNQALTRIFGNIAHGGRGRLPQSVFSGDERGPFIEVSASGISVRENGSALGVSQSGVRPAAVSVSVQGSASARYVDADTGQVTITSVYVQ